MRVPLLVVLAACAAAPTPSTVVSSGHAPAPIAFDYDRDAPLGWIDDSSEPRGAAIVHKGSYASRGGRVSAILVEPTGERRAGIVFVHWSQGNRTELVADAIALAEHGVESVLPTARRAATDREQYLQAVIDMRRAIDLLLSRGVDPQRIAFVGHSFGAHIGGIIAGVDGRPHAYVLVAGVASLSEYLRTTPAAVIAEARAGTPASQWSQYVASMAPLDARHFAPNAAPTAYLLQYARDDEIVPPPEADRYRAIVRGEVDLRWYDGGHELLDPHAIEDRRAWLVAHLVR